MIEPIFFSMENLFLGSPEDLDRSVKSIFAIARVSSNLSSNSRIVLLSSTIVPFCSGFNGYSSDNLFSAPQLIIIFDSSSISSRSIMSFSIICVRNLPLMKFLSDINLRICGNMIAEVHLLNSLVCLQNLL